jgi:hypothetical protein
VVGVGIGEVGTGVGETEGGAVGEVEGEGAAEGIDVGERVGVDVGAGPGPGWDGPGRPGTATGMTGTGTVFWPLMEIFVSREISTAMPRMRTRMTPTTRPAMRSSIFGGRLLRIYAQAPKSVAVIPTREPRIPIAWLIAMSMLLSIIYIIFAELCSKNP